MSRWTDLTAAELEALSAKNRASRVHRVEPPAKRGKARVAKPPKECILALPDKPERHPGVTISLTWPPTVNHYWLLGRGGRRFISGEGLTFRAETLFRARGLPLTSGQVAISVIAYPPDRKRRDLDNLLKSLLDALQHAGLIEDDSNVADLRITRAEQVKGGAVAVEIRAAP